MVRALVHDPLFLGRSGLPAKASEEDRQIGMDLLDTLLAHRENCVGMAANMIGAQKRIIAVLDGEKPLLLYNPVLLRAEGAYETAEGCLSLLGDPRPVKRYQKIKLQYEDADFRVRTKTFTGFTAQILQHEIDHCNGVLI